MKQILIWTFLFISCSDNNLSGYTFYGENQPNPLDEWVDKNEINFVSKPKKITLTEFSFFDNLARTIVNEPKKNIRIYTFNESGNLINFKTDYKDIVFTYNKNGLIETIENLGEDKDKFVNKYDNYQNLIDFKKYYNNEFKGGYKTTFDKEDANTIVIKRDLGEVKQKHTCKFDTKKRIISLSSESDSFKERTTFSYSNTGKLLSREWTNIPKDQNYKLEIRKLFENKYFEYDNSDRIKKIKTKSIFGVSKKKISEANYYYDEFGNEIRYVISDNGIERNKQSRRRQYTFDKNNNWITCETFNLDNQLISKSTRVISY